MRTESHWESVYSTKSAESVSWYTPHLVRSLQYIRRAASDRHASIIDVGAGESTLMDDLLDDGYLDLTALDVSMTALEVTRRRLGDRANLVVWKGADVLDDAWPAASFDVWHDRAVFHFLTNDWDRARYVAQVLHVLKPGGFAIVGAFGPDGPQQCSGLEVARYAPDELHARFGAQFELLESISETHITPWGTPQQFVYCFCRRHAR